MVLLIDPVPTLNIDLVKVSRVAVPEEELVVDVHKSAGSSEDKKASFCVYELKSIL